MTGSFPKDEIDHINHNRLDNKWSNLRKASRKENMQNYKKPATNTSGYMGVCWHKNAKKWIASIRINNKRIHLGSFNTAEEGYNAYLNAKEKYHLFQPTINT